MSLTVAGMVGVVALYGAVLVAFHSLKPGLQ